MASLSDSDTSEIIIGADVNSGGPTYFTTGTFDDVMVFNRALSDAEIAQLAQ